MTAQTTYDQTPAVGFSGMLSEQFSQRQVDSYLAVPGPIASGDAVEYVASTENVRHATVLGTAANIIGVALFSLHQENPEGTFMYKDKSEFPVIARGRVYAVAGGAVAVGDELTPSTGTGTKWTSGANAGATTKAYARTAAGADGDIFIIELVGP